MSYFASSSSYSNTFLVSTFTISQKHSFKNANGTLHPASHASSRPAAPGAILDTLPCGVNVFLFSIVLSFYYVLIVSNLGTLEGILDFLPKVYWEIKTNNIVKTKRYFIDNLRNPKSPIRKRCFNPSPPHCKCSSHTRFSPPHPWQR